MPMTLKDIEGMGCPLHGPTCPSCTEPVEVREAFEWLVRELKAVTTELAAYRRDNEEPRAGGRNGECPACGSIWYDLRGTACHRFRRCRTCGQRYYNDEDA